MAVTTTMMVMLSVRSVVVVLLGALGVLVCALAQRRRRESEARAKAWTDPQKQCEAIYRHLCCHEFPWECFYAINFAFYRAFASPSIARLYHSTGTFPFRLLSPPWMAVNVARDQLCGPASRTLVFMRARVSRQHRQRCWQANR
jgi:hypothetical protein